MHPTPPLKRMLRNADPFHRFSPMRIYLNYKELPGINHRFLTVVLEETTGHCPNACSHCNARHKQCGKLKMYRDGLIKELAKLIRYKAVPYYRMTGRKTILLIGQNVEILLSETIVDKHKLLFTELEDCEAIMYFLHCRNIDPDGLLSQLEPWQDQIVLHNTLHMPGGDPGGISGNSPSYKQTTRLMQRAGRRGWRFSPRLQITKPGDVMLYVQDVEKYWQYLYHNMLTFYPIRFRPKDRPQAIEFFKRYGNISLDDLSDTPYNMRNLSDNQLNDRQGLIEWIHWKEDLLAVEMEYAQLLLDPRYILMDRADRADLEDLGIKSIDHGQPKCMHLGTGHCIYKRAERYCTNPGRNGRHKDCVLLKASLKTLHALTDEAFDTMLSVEWKADHTVLVHMINTYAGLMNKHYSDEYMEVISEGSAEEYPLRQRGNDLSSDQSL